jgi:hypothetical protein
MIYSMQYVCATRMAGISAGSEIGAETIVSATPPDTWTLCVVRG